MTSLRDGNIDVAVYSGAAPTSAITDLATAKSVRFIPIVEAKAKEVMETHPFFFVDSLKAGTYPGMDSDVTTLDRKRVVSGKSVSVRVDLDGRRSLQKKN